MIENKKMISRYWFALLRANVVFGVIYLIILGSISFFINHELSEQVVLTIIMVFPATIIYVQIINSLFFLPVVITKHVPPLVSIILILAALGKDYITMIVFIIPSIFNYLYLLSVIKNWSVTE